MQSAIPWTGALHGTSNQLIKYALFLMPTLAALGGYLAIFWPVDLGSVDAFRVVAIGLIIAAVSTQPHRSRHSRVSFLYGLFATSFLIFGAGHLISQPIGYSGWREFLIVLVPLTLGFALIRLARSIELVTKHLLTGWVFALTVSAAIAIWELVTLSHLPSPIADYLALYPDYRWVSASFGNPNDYAGFLLVSLPILLYVSAITARRHVAATGSCIIGLLIFFTDSRWSIAAFILILLSWVVLSIRTSRTNSKFIYVSIVWLIFVTSALVFALTQRQYAQEAFGTSGTARIKTAQVSFEAFLNSYGLGNGPASLARIAETNSDFKGSHLLLLDFLAQYGALTGLAFISLICILFYIGLRESLASRSHHRALAGRLLLTTLIGLTVWSVASSSTLTRPSFWLGLIVVVLIGMQLETNRTTVLARGPTRSTRTRLDAPKGDPRRFLTPHGRSRRVESFPLRQ